MVQNHMKSRRDNAWQNVLNVEKTFNPRKPGKWRENQTNKEKGRS